MNTTTFKKVLIPIGSAIFTIVILGKTAPLLLSLATLKYLSICLAGLIFLGFIALTVLFNSIVKNIKSGFKEKKEIILLCSSAITVTGCYLSINSILNGMRRIMSIFLGIWLAAKITKSFKETLLTMAAYYIVLLLIIEIIQWIRNWLKNPSLAK